MVSYREVGEILATVDRLDCDSLVLEYGDLRLSVTRGSEAPTDPGSGPERLPAADAAIRTTDSQPADPGGTATPENPSTAESPAGPDGAAIPEGWTAVRAPMAGTFYRSPGPEQPPFVEIGTQVSAGQVIGLLEVMKLFTELKSEQQGTVVRIDAQDGSLVEYDQPMVWIEPR